VAHVTRRTLVLSVVSALIIRSRCIAAQPAQRVFRIGVLSPLELVLNLKSAKALGIKIPDSILVRADKVLE